MSIYYYLRRGISNGSGADFFMTKVLYSKGAYLYVRTVILGCLLISCNRLFSQTPDWSTSIAPIIYDHCSHCHHANAIAPFTLMSYDDAVAWAFSIETQINAKLMPPWPPDPNYNHLKDENVLTADQISSINSWVDNGMPLGNPDLAPPPPVFNGGSLMVDPDETIHLPVFTVPATGDVYWRFATQSGYTEAKYLNAVEFVAGNPPSVHHLQFSDDPSGVSWQDDLNYPGPGYPKDSSTSTSVDPFMAQSEGRIISLPPNIGFKIPANADYVTDVHYYTFTSPQVDSSKINIKFCAVEDVRPVETERLIYEKWPSLIDTPFVIPANTVKTLHLQTQAFTSDKSMLGLGPHAHLLCKSWKVYMLVPSGDTVPLISIPNWDFDWQGAYLLTKVLKVPEGSQIFATAVYDNTINNPKNPNNPPIDVKYGETRSDEMSQVRFWLMDYEPGDEDIILDSAFYGLATGNTSVVSENYLNLFPNPASQKITVKYSGTNAENTHFFVYNNLGKLLLTNDRSAENRSNVELDCSAFPPGIYLLQARSGVNVSTRKFIIER